VDQDVKVFAIDSLVLANEKAEEVAAVIPRPAAKLIPNLIN
jgi:hypothetical protein